MGKVCTDPILDGLLDVVAGLTTITICTAEPTSVAECDSLSLIPGHTLTGGDFTKAAGDTSGRKSTVSSQADLSIDATGTATHVAMADASDYYVTTCTSEALTSGGTITIPAFDIEVADPA